MSSNAFTILACLLLVAMASAATKRSTRSSGSALELQISALNQVTNGISLILKVGRDSILNGQTPPTPEVGR